MSVQQDDDQYLQQEIRENDQNDQQYLDQAVNPGVKQSKMDVNLDDSMDKEDANQDMFADGILEEFTEQYLIPTLSEKDLAELEEIRYQREKNKLILPFNSIIRPKRKNRIKIIIVKQRKEFGAPITFYDKEPGAEGNSEVKPAPKAHECPIMPKPILEIGFQTKFSTSSSVRNTKQFQVQKVSKTNSFTQVYPDNSDIKNIIQERAIEYLKSDKKDPSSGKTNLQKIELFIDLIRPKVEEALQSNETIDIFQSDFQLDRFGENEGMDSKAKKNESESEIRTFRDNTLAGQKSKREKSVNIIKLVKPNLEYIAHSLLRNLTFEERTKVIGIPYTGQILFWNFKDPEINSPVFVLDLPMEITTFEFNPENVNILVCGLISGQMIIFEFFKLLHILQNGFDSEYSEKLSKTNKNELYTYYITGITESHKSNINSMKWLDKGFSFHKYQLNYNENVNDINLLATVAEDGQVSIWDILHLDKTIKNEVSNYIKPVIKVEINKIDSLLKIQGTSLELKLKNFAEPYIYVGTNEGQVYSLDWREKVSPENLTGNLKRIYSPCYFRPVLSLEFSSFYEDIFLTVHDFSFSIWNTSYSIKPILQSPNLKSNFYVCGRFSKSRPGVIFFARNTGQIDIWDLLDESHKPSVKETFLKESVVYIDLILYKPVIEDENLNKRFITQEYLVIGDQSGQLTMMIIPNLFSEQVSDEKELIRKFFDNELHRQKYMDVRYKSLEEEYSKPIGEIEMLINPPPKDKDKEEVKEESEWKYLEEAFVLERQKIIEKYGFNVDEENITQNDDLGDEDDK